MCPASESSADECAMIPATTSNRKAMPVMYRHRRHCDVHL
jgi:hypothetical protein